MVGLRSMRTKVASAEREGRRDREKGKSSFARGNEEDEQTKSNTENMYTEKT